MYIYQYVFFDAVITITVVSCNKALEHNIHSTLIYNIYLYNL